MSLLIWLIAPSVAGYGDAVDGLPTHAERETHLWTNAVRLDPEHFRDDYRCSFSGFSSSEKKPKIPLLIHLGLTEAAHVHSDDMHDQGYFTHDSIDGTPWNVRIGRYYPSGYVAENIANGYRDPFAAVIEGWMCSSGHRRNIMSSSYDELGAGVSGRYYTQDFGRRSGITDRPIAMGLHLPKNPGNRVEFIADFFHRSAPHAVEVIVDGQPYPLDLVLGEPDAGVYWAKVPTPAGSCHEYYFAATNSAGTVTFPQDGSYGWGNCTWDDAGARWLDGQIPPPEPEPAPEPEPEPDPEPEPTDPVDEADPKQPADDRGAAASGRPPASGTACATSLPSSGLLGLAAVLLSIRRRRR